MLNPELKARWIADLRANPQLQARNKLRDTEGKNCCLGRLCLLQGIPWDGAHFVFSTRLSNSTPPTLYRKEIGMPEHIMDILIEMNDSQEKTFPEIANYLESLMGI
jgi:hypothetical protein